VQITPAAAVVVMTPAVAAAVMTPAAAAAKSDLPKRLRNQP
jgi:hypothetical protein